MSLAQRVLITAGASGIGLQMAHAFAAGGASVRVTDVDQAALAALPDGIRGDRVDASDEAAMDGLFAAIRASWGGLDVLCANAGIKGPTAPVAEMPRLGCINVHGSILPKYRGAAPVQWCIARGEKETGITTMLMDAGMDTGPMLLKAYTSIALLDNAEQVGATLGQMGADLLLETLSKLDRGEITPIPQNNDD